MMIRIREAQASEEIYRYQMGFDSPNFFPAPFDAWKESFEADVDGAGRILFKELTCRAAYDDGALVGFIQYGRTAFGFDSTGEISTEVSHCVIRSLYFSRDHQDAGELLLKEAMDAFTGAETVYAFFHYFGMSCFARHGKLFQGHPHIEELLRCAGFETEHENVYYASALKDGGDSEVQIAAQEMTRGGQQYMDFLLAGEQVGGCEIHFVDAQTAYLRWIYVNGNITGRGIGTGCMNALKCLLYEKGIRRFDTDTALSNTVARHFYEKNDFTRAGITRSYYRKNG